jgi:hypothetical protein
MLSAAAYAAAKYENPSMKNYRGGQESAAGGHVEKIVSTYLSMRTSHAIVGMTRSPYAPYLSQSGLAIIDRETSWYEFSLPSSVELEISSSDFRNDKNLCKHERGVCLQICLDAKLLKN